MNDPKISVIMPAYNAKRYIAEAIESILNQTFKDFEFIIIDDCSIDNTWEIIQEYAKKDKRIIPLINKDNLKLSKTLNEGIAIARGKYIARMDADDISVEDRLQRQFDYMEKNSDVGIVGGSMEIRDLNNKIIGKRRYNLADDQIRKKIYRYSPFCHPLIMIRKSVLSQIGDYDEKWNPAEDYELYFRIGKCSKFANLDDVLLKYRIVPKSMTTASKNKMGLKTIEIRKKYSNEAPYKMSLFDRVYTFLQYLAVYIVPMKCKIWLFHFLRDSK